MPGWLERQLAFGSDPATTMSPRAQAAWDASQADYEASGRAAAYRNRKRLTDQSRTEAYDPTLDMYDPTNLRPVDYQGQTLWTVNPNPEPPKPRAQPATVSSNSKAITDKINKAIASSDVGIPPPVTTADFLSPGLPQGTPPMSGLPSVDLSMPLDELMPLGLDPRAVTAGPRPRPSASASSSGGGGGGGDPWGISSLPVPFAPLVGAGKLATSPTAKGYIDWRNRKLDAAEQWFNRLIGKADGGRIGYAAGGEAGDPDPNDDFLPMTAFGGVPNIGPSHAVIGQPVAPPQMPAGGGGGGGGKGGGGIGSLLGPLGAIAGSFIPGVGTMIGGMAGSAIGGMMQAEGGPIRQPFMRGGYPDFHNTPPLPVSGLPQRTAFSTGGGDHHVRPDGRGNGRSDHIDASLSPGEFVMDAETVSLAGDGDNDAGARQFENLRKKIRTHKGKALAKGKFSPKAKPVEAYMSDKLSASDRMAHSGMSDGLRARRS